MTDQPPNLEENQEHVTPLHEDEVKILKSELENEKEKANSYLIKLTYLQADLENYKKRTRKEVEDTIRYGNRTLILELLTIIDELECALEAGKNDPDNALVKGVELTLKKLYSILKKEGLSKIETIGTLFDPTKHEAVHRVQSEDKDGVIVEEVRKGFMLNDM